MKKTNTDNILTSFLLTLFSGTLIRVIFLYVNQTTLDISIYKTFFVGLMIDSLVLSILFLPTLFFLILRIHPSKYLKVVLILQRFYLFTIIFLFLLTSFIDIFIFQVYHHRFNLFLIEKALQTPFPMLLNMLQLSFKYEIFLVPLLFIIAYGCTCWHISIKKIYYFFSKRIFSKKQIHREVVLKQQIKKLLVPYLLLFFFTSFVYIPFFSLKPLDWFIISQQKSYILQTASKNSFFHLFQEIFDNFSHYEGVTFDWMEYRFDFSKAEFQKLIKEDNVKFINNNERSFLRKFKNPQKAYQTKPHIILLNIDSLSQKFLEEENHLPYLKKISDEGVYFTNFYYHSNSSINAFLSLLFGTPIIHSKNFSTNDVFKEKQKVSLMNILENEGYKSVYAEGCTYDEYKVNEIFEKYGGYKTIKKIHFKSSLNKNKYMCTANDHQLTNRSLSEIEKIYNQAPLFIKIHLMTIHFSGNIPHVANYGHPKSFDVKKHCKISKDSIYNKKLQNGLCYIDFVVKGFVEKVSNLIGNNLIIVITGDHRLGGEPIYKEESLESAQVPLIIMDKRGLIPKGVIHKVASHQDVAPTLLYMIGYQGTYPFLGRSLLSQDTKEGFTIFQDRRFYHYRKGIYLLEYRNNYGQHESYLFKIRKRDKVKIPLDDDKLRLELEKEFKQYMAGLAMWHSVDHHITKKQ